MIKFLFSIFLSSFIKNDQFNVNSPLQLQLEDGLLQGTFCQFHLGLDV